MPKPYWNPYVAGIALGLVMLAGFVTTGKGLGASGTVKRLDAVLLHAANPTWAEENGNLKGLFEPGRSPLSDWLIFLSLGSAIGGLVGAVTGRRFKVETVHGPRVARDVRWLLALLGGGLVGIAAQLARGCTSGQALTGGAQLALGSWVFMFAIFIGGYATAYFVRRQWL